MTNPKDELEKAIFMAVLAMDTYQRGVNSELQS